MLDRTRGTISAGDLQRLKDDPARVDGRRWIPLLVAEIERLREQLKDLKTWRASERSGLHGWRVRSGGADAFIRRVHELPLPGRLLSEVAPLLAVMRHVNRQLAYSDERIETVTRTDERVRRLRTVSSVGPVTAAAFVAALDDVTRFQRAHYVAAYLGLVPRELSSGESQHRGRITKAGSPRVRQLLVQAAVSLLRVPDPQTAALRAWTLGIAARRGKKIVVALARRLAGILFAMLRDGTTYEPRAARRHHGGAAHTARA